MWRKTIRRSVQTSINKLHLFYSFVQVRYTCFPLHNGRLITPLCTWSIEKRHLKWLINYNSALLLWCRGSRMHHRHLVQKHCPCYTGSNDANMLLATDIHSGKKWHRLYIHNQSFRQDTIWSCSDTNSHALAAIAHNERMIRCWGRLWCFTNKCETQTTFACAWWANHDDL